MDYHLLWTWPLELQHKIWIWKVVHISKGGIGKWILKYMTRIKQNLYKFFEMLGDSIIPYWHQRIVMLVRHIFWCQWIHGENKRKVTLLDSKYGLTIIVWMGEKIFIKDKYISTICQMERNPPWNWVSFFP